MNNIAIRHASPEDVPQIVQFLKENMGEGLIPRTEAYWRWKHEKNPFGPSPILLAESGGRIISLRAFLRWQWTMNGRTVNAWRAVDTCTATDFRRKGLFNRLTRQLLDQAASENVGFIFNTPNANSLPGYLKMGWMKIGRIPVYIRPIRFFRGICHYLRKNGPDEVECADAFSTVSDFLDQLKNRHPGFLTAAGDDSKRFQVFPTLKYLKWRYADVPGFCYRALWDIRRAKGAAVIFHVRRRYNLKEMTLSEMMRTMDEQGVTSLKRLLKALMKQSEADYLAAGVSKDGMRRKTVMKAGFFPVPGPILTIKRIDQALTPNPARLHNWQAGIGALEIF